MAKKAPGGRPKKAKKAAEPDVPLEVKVREQTETLRGYIELMGPLFVRAWVPDYSRNDDGGYPPWYVGHLDCDMLDDEQLQSYVGECYDDPEDRREPDAADRLTKFLETKGYICFHSYPGGVLTLRIEDA
jgi:hypothetical protein